MHITKILALGCLGLVLIPAETFARELPHGVIDSAGLFTPLGIERAQRQIDQLFLRREFPVVVETLAHLPDSLLQPLRRASNSTRGRLFKTFAQERAQQQQIEGLYILISSDPNLRLVQVCTSGQAFKARFSDSSCNKVRLGFVDHPTRSGLDAALLQALDEVDALLLSSHPQIHSFWILVPVLFVGIVGMWLILLFRRARNPNRPAVPSLATPESGQPNLFGSMVGTPANQWIYDKSLEPPASAS